MTSTRKNNEINIFPFSKNFFKDTNNFKRFLGVELPESLKVEHTQLRKPNLMIFAYQGDHSLWGYAEIEGWRNPDGREVMEGSEWAGKNWRRVYLIKPCSLREFKRHVPYIYLASLGFDTTSIVYAPRISAETFDKLLEKAEGEINLCKFQGDSGSTS